MAKLKTLIRILVFISFLAPFLTCNKSDISTVLATNPEAGYSDMNNDTNTVAQDTAGMAHERSSGLNTQTKKPDDESLWDKIWDQIIYPTDDSVSGFGSIFLPPNLTGQISIALCFLLSFFLLFPWPFLKIKKRRFYFELAQFLCIIIFIVMALLSDGVHVLWGAWVLLGLIIVGLILEPRNNPGTVVQ